MKRPAHIRAYTRVSKQYIATNTRLAREIGFKKPKRRRPALSRTSTGG